MNFSFLNQHTLESTSACFDHLNTTSDIYFPFNGKWLNQAIL